MLLRAVVAAIVVAAVSELADRRRNGKRAARTAFGPWRGTIDVIPPWCTQAAQ